MAKHKPSIIWSVKKFGEYPQGYVQTKDKTTLHISLFENFNTNGSGFDCSRRFAKMLARRINQCLEDTR